MGEEEDSAANQAMFAAIAESSGLDVEQIEGLKKGFEGFDKEGGGRRRAGESEVNACFSHLR